MRTTTQVNPGNITLNKSGTEDHIVCDMKDPKQANRNKQIADCLELERIEKLGLDD